MPRLKRTLFSLFIFVAGVLVWVLLLHSCIVRN